MRLLIATGKPAKFDRYATLARQLPNVEIVSPGELQLGLTVVEDGTTAEENARKKARAYAQATGIPALGVDEALYIAGLPPDEQPRTHVRRYAGRAASDDELLTLFLRKIERLPVDQRHATWHYAICLALPTGQEFHGQAMVHTCFTDRPCFPLRPGYPLQSLQLDSLSGKPLRLLTPEEEAARLVPVAARVRDVVYAARRQYRFHTEEEPSP